MGCREIEVGGTTAVVCAPASVTLRLVRWCPMCERRRRFVGNWYVWYPAIWTCLGCGHEWCEGYRMPAPWSPKWWVPRIAKAKRQWAGAPDRAEARRMQRQMLDEVLSPDGQETE